MRSRKAVLWSCSVLLLLIVGFLILRTGQKNETVLTATNGVQNSSSEHLAPQRLEPNFPDFPGSKAIKRRIASQRFFERMNGPVEFYGKAIDQNGNPVVGARLTMRFSVYNNDPARSSLPVIETTNILATDASGLCSFSAPRGGALRLDGIEKDGYLWNSPVFLTFNYGFHKPSGVPDYADPKKRALFHMWKKGVPEPVIQHGVRVPLSDQQDAYGVNLLAGKMAGAGEFADLLIRIPLVEEAAGATRGDRWFIFQAPNGGIVETSDAYTYAAPREGYEPQWKWLHAIGQPGSEQWRRNFYVKMRNGQAYAGLTITWGLAGTAFEITATVNPNASPMLEPDTTKQVTDPEEVRRLDEATRLK